MRQTWMVRPTRMGVASAVRWPSRSERRWLALSSIPTTPLSGPALMRAAEAGGRLGQQRRDAAVEDAVGLVHPPVDGQAQDDALGAGLDGLDVEQTVDARGLVGQRGRGAATGRKGSGHRRTLVVHR